MNERLETAYRCTLDVVRELEESGIPVKILPSPARSTQVRQKYNRPDRLPPDLWVLVEFCPIPEQASLIHEQARNLRALGIVFDTGGGCGTRDWELDWSFRLDSSGEGADRLDEVEDVLAVVESDAWDSPADSR